MKNAFNRLISGLDMAKERISELEDMTIETSQTENRREKRLKTKMERTILGLWDNHKGYSIRVMRIPEKTENGIEEIF